MLTLFVCHLPELVLKFRRVTIRGAQPLRGSPRKFASQRGSQRLLRGSLPWRGSLGFYGALRGFSKGSGPMLVTRASSVTVSFCLYVTFVCSCVVLCAYLSPYDFWCWVSSLSDEEIRFLSIFPLPIPIAIDLSGESSIG